MARLIDANELKKQITGMAKVNKSMNKLVLLLACVLLTGCAPARQGAVVFEKSGTTESTEVVEVLGDGYFTVVYSNGLIKEEKVYYTTYKDAETGYCFIRLKSAAINSLLIPLVENDGSYKKYSDSNTNEIIWLGVSKDRAVNIIRDEDTGVEYVIDASINSYFIRSTSNEMPI